MKKIFFILFYLITNLSSIAQTDTAVVENLLNKGNIKEAKVILEKGNSSFAGDKYTLAHLGDIAGFEQNWDKALHYYKTLVELEPENAEYNFKYGGALGMKALQVSKFKAVIYIPDIKKHLEKAAKLDKDHVKSRRALVELYMQLPMLLGGSESKAKQFAHELDEIDPLEAALSHGFILKENGNEKEALKHFQKALIHAKNITREKEDNYLNYELGKIAAEYDVDLKNGLKFLDTYLANYNYRDIHSLEWVYYRKAQIQAKLNNKAEATKSINRALAIRQDFSEAKIEKRKILEL
jgi:tetratricopeptide (TPR) repeat protein